MVKWQRTASKGNQRDTDVKTMIIVRGFPKSGKTTTIRRAFVELRQKAKVIDSGKGSKEVRGGILEIDGVNVGFNSPGDVAAPLEEELKNLIDGVKVGFTSPSDVADPLKEDLNRLIRNNCSVIVCTARRSSNGPSVTFQAAKRCAAKAQPPFNVVLIEKQPDADADQQPADGRRNQSCRPQSGCRSPASRVCGSLTATGRTMSRESHLNVH